MNESLLDLRTRSSWALARISALVDEGRSNGWLPGTPFQQPDLGLILRAAEPLAAPMRLLAERLSLDALELDVLWMLACIELDPQVSRATQLLGTAELNAQLLERSITLGLAIENDMFERLQQLALIDVTEGPAYRRLVRLDDRVVDLVRGRFDLDRKLREFVTLQPKVNIPRVHSIIELAPNTTIMVSGAIGSGRVTALRKRAAASGVASLLVNSNELSKDANVFERQIRSIVRECRLHSAWPIFREADDALPAIEHAMRMAQDVPLMASVRSAVAPRSRHAIHSELKIPSVSERAAIWNQTLPDEVSEVCARRYAITPGMIETCAAAARATNQNVTVNDVHDTLRVHLERQLKGLATRIDTKQTWDDLVLPVDQMDLLIELVARVRHRDLVLEQWGFGDKIGRGQGLSALVSGPPGTGKTMLAGLLASELGLDLYQVDLSKIVSKYIGETEKQLSELFDAAESGQAIILFDEADSLFAKRSEVRSSNDRYANLEVNYLLQRIDAFTGIALLTTNHETAIDPAFMRRLAFHIRVPMPEEGQRILLWEGMLPKRAERAGNLDFARLASEFEMSGGYIKNAVLRAAFLSADEGTPITNAHLFRGARAEYEAMGKLVHGRA